MVRINGGNLKNVREIIMGIERVEFRVVEIVFFLNLFYIVKWWKSKKKCIIFVFLFIFKLFLFGEYINIIFLFVKLN